MAGSDAANELKGPGGKADSEGNLATYRKLGQEILLILGDPDDLSTTIHRVVNLVRGTLQLDAVGLRLNEKNDYPYFYQEGFSEEFVRLENSLLGRESKDWGAATSLCGRLECTCGLVVSGQTDPSNALFTHGGSAWTNDSLPILEVPLEEDPRFHPRNQCIHQGYMSIALIPLKARGSISGLIQLVDRRKDRFFREGIEMLESFAIIIGEAVLRKRAEHQQKERMKELQAFYKLGELSTRQDIKIPDLLKEIVGFLPQSLQYPEISCSRIRLKNEEFRSQNYKESPWMISAPLVINGKNEGFIEVGYTEEKPFSDEGPFMKEERMLIDTMAIRLGHITEHRLAVKELLETRDKYRSLLQSTDQGIYGIDLEGKCTFINRSAQKILGYSEAECIGQNMHELIHHHYPAGEPFPVEECPIFRSMRSGKGCQVSTEIMWKKNGSPFPSEYSSFPLIEGSLIKGAVVALSDITERKQAEEDLKMAKEKAEESDRLKSAFLANMSHEIRTPLNAIVGFSGFFADPELGLEERMQFSKIIANRSEDLLSLINDILDISRIESGNAVAVKEPISLNEILDDLEMDFIFRIQRMDKSKLGLEFKKALPADDSVFISDRHIIKQVFSNLIHNAIKFTESGTIQIGYHPPQNGLIICYVADTGIGIPEKEQSLVFEHFRQASNEHSQKIYGGTGLGLAICKGALDLIGGKIWVDSRLGEGSTFFFSIPFERHEKKKPEQVQIPDKNADPAGKWAGKKILVVEDEENNIELMRFYLKPTNVSVDIAINGKETRNYYKKLKDIDLILLDIRLPDVSGLELVKEIKKIRPDIPVVAQTAYAMSTDKKKSFDAGCDDFISKPIAKEKLMNLLGGYLG